MVSTVASYVLTKFLGKYIEGLDDKVSVGILSGDLSLENLKIKKSAIEGKFTLPVELKEGFLEKLSLTFPWKNLSGEPAVIRITNLFLLVGATQSSQTKDNIDGKLQRLNLDELLGIDLPDKRVTDTQTPGYIESLVTKVTDNLQIYINNIHIRYEDDISNPLHPFSFGITLHNLHIQSTDEFWKSTFLQVGKPVIHKIFEMNHLSVYLDTNPTFIKYANNKEFVQKMESLIPTTSTDVIHQYIFKPISGLVKANINKSKVDFKRPKFILDLVLENITSTIDRSQYHRLIDWIRKYNTYFDYTKKRPFSSPILRPTENPHAWWKYIYQSLVMDIRNKKKCWTWEYIKKRKEQQIEYIELFKKRKTLGENNITQQEQDRFNQIQNDWDYNDLHQWRLLANASLEVENKKKKEQQTAYNWLSSWWGSSAPTNIKKETGNDFDLKELYDIIGFDDEQSLSESQIPTDYVKTRINFTIKSNVYNLFDDKSKTQIMEANFSGLQLNINFLKNNTKIFSKLDTFCIREYYQQTPHIRVEPDHFKILKEKKLSEDMPSSLLEIKINYKPIKIPVDYILKVKSQPIVVHFSYPMIDRIMDFFKMDVEQSDLLWITQQSFETIKKTAQLRLQKALQSESTSLKEFSIHSCTVIIPKTFTNENCDIFVLDVGNLTLSSDLASQLLKKNMQISLSNSNEEKTILKEEDFYNSFNVNLRGFNAYVTKDIENWRIPDKVEDTAYIVPKFDLSIRLQIRSPHLPVEDMPQFIISGSISQLSILLTSDYLRSALSVINEVVEQMASNDVIRELTPDLEEMNYIVHKSVRFDFKLEKMNIIIYNTAEKESTVLPLFNLDFDKVNMHIEVNSDQIIFVSNLRSFIMQDIMHKNEQENTPKYVIKAMYDEKLFNFHYRKYSSKSKLFNEVESEVNIEVGKIDFIVDRPAVIFLLDTINETLKVMKQTMPKQDTRLKFTNPENSSVYCSADDELLETVETIVAPEIVVNNIKNNKIGSSVKMKVQASDWTFTLQKNDKPFFFITLSDGGFDVDIKKDDIFLLKGGLGKLSAKDLYDTKWSNTVNIQSDQVATFQFYSIPSIHPEYPGYDAHFSMQIGSLQLVYINSIFMEVKNYYDGFNEIKNAFQYLQDLEIDTKPYKLKLDIDLLKTSVIIPQNSSSSNFLSLSVENGKLTNVFVYVDQIEIDKWLFNATNFEMCTNLEKPQEKNETGCLVEDTNIQIKVYRTIFGNLNHIRPDLQVKINIDKINVNVDGKQLIQIGHVINQNLRVGPTIENKDELYFIQRRMSTIRSSMLDLCPSPVITTVWILYKVELCLNSFSFTIREDIIPYYSIKTKNTSIPDPLVQLEIDNFEINYIQKTDDSLDTNLSVYGIIVRDIRPKRVNVVSKIFSLSRTDEKINLSENKNKALKIIYKSSGKKNEIDIKIDHPCITPVPQFFQAMNEKFVKPYFIDIFNVYTSGPVTVKQPQRVPLFLNILMMSPRIYFLRKCTVPLRTKAFVFNLGDWQITYNSGLDKTQLLFQMTHIYAHHSHLFDIKNFKSGQIVPIIENLDVIIKISTIKNNQVVNIELSPINMITQCSDLATATKVYLEWIENFQKNTSKDETKKQLKKPQLESSNYTQTAHVNISTISFSFKNDKLEKGFPIPVFQANIKQSYISFKRVNSQMFDTNIIINKIIFEAYNNTAAEWEPIVDPWDVTLNIQKDNSSCVSATIESNNPLLFNFPLSLVYSSMHIGSMLKRSMHKWLQKQKNKIQLKRAPHWITIFNDTGRNILYWTSPKKKCPLSHGVEHPLDLSQLKSAEKGLSFMLDEPGFDYTEISGVYWNKVGVNIYCHISQIETTERVVVEVMDTQGMRKIIIHSDESIKNFTGNPIDVQLIDKDNRNTIQYTLGPGEKRAIPMDMAGDHYNLLIRPNKNYNWILWVKSEKYLISNSRNYPNWVGVIIPVQKLYNHRLDYSIEIHPMIMIENCFASPLMYKTISSRQESNHFTIQSKEEHSLVHPATNNIRDLKIMFNLKGFKWTKPVFVSSTISDVPITLDFDAEPSGFNINISCHERPNGVIHMTVYCPYWIINHTGYQLAYYDKLQRLAPGQDMNTLQSLSKSVSYIEKEGKVCRKCYQCFSYSEDLEIHILTTHVDEVESFEKSFRSEELHHWEYEKNDNEWCKFDFISQKIIEDTWNAQKEMVILKHGRYYENNYVTIFFQRGKIYQVNSEGYQRNVRRYMIHIEEKASRFNSSFTVNYGDNNTQNIFYYSPKRISITVDNSTPFSEVESLNAQNNGKIIKLINNDHTLYNFALNITLGQEKFWRTNIVRICPAIILVNLCTNSLCYKQTNHISYWILSQNSQTPFYWPSDIYPLTIEVLLDVKSHGWSEAISIENLGTYQIKLRPLSCKYLEYLNVEIKLVGVIKYVIFRNNEPLFKIRNSLKYFKLLVWEENQEPVKIKNGNEINWYWENPIQQKYNLQVKFLFGEFIDNNNTVVDFNKIRNKILTIGKNKIELSVSLEGICKVLHCRLASHTEKDKLLKRSWKITCFLPSIGLSIIDGKPRELIYLHFYSPQFYLEYSKVHWDFHCSIKKFQADNQIHGGLHPILMYSQKNDKFLNINIVKDTRYSTLDYYRKISFEFQKINICCDTIILTYILDWYNNIIFHSQVLSNTDQSSKIISGDKFDLIKIDPEIIKCSTCTYFEELKIHPIKMKLTFSHTYCQNEGVDYASLDKIRNVLTFMPTISDAEICLQQMEVQHFLISKDRVSEVIINTYVSASTNQAYKLLFGYADFLGAPLASLNHISSGFKSMVDPAKSITHDPINSSVEITKGSLKVVDGVVKGVFGGAAKVTGAASRAMAYAALDKEYLQKRNKESHYKPKNVADGLLKGVFNVGMGVFDGITGIVTQPIKGLEEDGVEGLMTGFLKGTVGAVVKPVVATMDLISKTNEGIANTTSFKKNDRKRVRETRAFDERRIVLVYSAEAASGQSLLYSLKKEKYLNHIYHYHIRFTLKNNESFIALITNKLFFLISVPSQTISFKFPLLQFIDCAISGDILKIVFFNENWSLRNYTIQSQHTAALKEIKSQLHLITNQFFIGYVKLRKRDSIKYSKETVRTHQQKRGSLSDWRLKKKGDLDNHPCVVEDGYLNYQKNLYYLKDCYCFADVKPLCFVLIYNNITVKFKTVSEKEKQEWIDVCLYNGAKSRYKETYLH